MDFFRTKVDIMVIYANAFDSKGLVSCKLSIKK